MPKRLDELHTDRPMPVNSDPKVIAIESARKTILATLERDPSNWHSEADFQDAVRAGMSLPDSEIDPTVREALALLVRDLDRRYDAAGVAHYSRRAEEQ
ncbi:MAG: hypothetical protein IAG13_25295 [Deltaproteobacteria bacterium]|nr:hypothetical protein [Nannocystaceae bacterium]